MSYWETCDYCGASGRIIKIKIKSNLGNRNEFNICKNRASCKLLFFTEIPRFLNDTLELDYLN